MRRGFMFLAALTLATTLAVPASAGGADAAAALYPPDAEPFGMTYAEWQGTYQVWLGEIPAPEKPTSRPRKSSQLRRAAGRRHRIYRAGRR